MRQIVQIDPFQLEEPEQLKAFKDLLHVYPNEKAFINGSIYRTDAMEITLTHTILVHEDLTKQRTYRIISNEAFGEGSQGDLSTMVYLIDYTLRLDAEGSPELIEQEPPLIAKCTSTKKTSSTQLGFQLEASMTNEYLRSHSGHLQTEFPIFKISMSKNKATGEISHQGLAILVQRKMPGFELHNLLRLILDENLEVSVHLRLMLTIQLLETIQKQITSEGITHGDIKPANIMLHFEQTSDIESQDLADKNFKPKSSMNVIDYQGAAPHGNRAPYSVFSSDYVDPKRDKTKANPSDDVYSAGKTAAGFWSIHPKETDELQEPQNLKECLETQAEYDVYNEPQLFSTSILPDIYGAILWMTEPDPKKRCSLEQAILCFQSIENKYRELIGKGPLTTSSGIASPDPLSNNDSDNSTPLDSNAPSPYGKKG